MALLGQLAGGLAHELRNPLSAISGAVEILSTEAKQSDVSYRLSKVATREIERLNLMVEDFLLPVNSIHRLVRIPARMLSMIDVPRLTRKCRFRSNLRH